jgi:hypothetical protein
LDLQPVIHPVRGAFAPGVSGQAKGRLGRDVADRNAHQRRRDFSGSK